MNDLVEAMLAISGVINLIDRWGVISNEVRVANPHECYNERLN